MKTKLLIAFAMMAFACNSASAQIEIFFSTSDTDANAGTVLDLVFGDTGSIYTWAINNDSANINAVQIDILSSDASILQALSHEFDANTDWFNTDSGELGDLVIDADALSFSTGDGVANDGMAVLLSEIVVEATAEGATNLSIQEQADGGVVSTWDGSPASLNFGGATVNVVSAIPEPSSMVLLSGLACLAGVLRRRS